MHCEDVCLLEYVEYACPLQSVSHPYLSPVHQLDAQDASTFLLVVVIGIPFVPMIPEEMIIFLGEPCQRLMNLF